MADNDNSGAWNAAGQVAAAGVAAIGQSVGTKNSFKRSKELMELQMQNQEMMNDNAAKRQLKMWQDTNYGAQARELKNAGMSVGLMYGGSGGGGTTAGQNSAGSAAMGSAPKPQDVGAMTQAGKGIAELAMMKAGTEKLKAEARKANVEANVTEFGEQTKKDEYSVRNSELTNREAELWAERKAKNEYKGNDTGWDTIAKNEITNSKSEATKGVNEAIYSELKLQSEKLNQTLTAEKTKEIWHNIRQKWVAAGFKGLDAIIKIALK